MTKTVQQLVEILQGYPGNLVVSVKDVLQEQEFSIISFVPEGNTLIIEISEEKEGETGE